MKVIKLARLKEFWEKHSNAESSLYQWYRTAKLAEWQNFVDLRKILPSADQVSNFTVFNIGGNNYRLVTFIDYKYQTIFIRRVLTHAEYSKEDWKKDPWFK
jgi:mRNA interferase HigB